MNDFNNNMRTEWIESYIVQMNDTFDRIPHILSKQPNKSKACHKRIARLIGRIEYQAIGRRQ